MYTRIIIFLMINIICINSSISSNLCHDDDIFDFNYSIKGSYVCEGGVLKHSTYDFKELYKFPSHMYCQGALNESKSGFICAGRHLYSEASSIAITTYRSESECVYHLRESQQGFICNEEGSLFSKSSIKALTKLRNKDDCVLSVREAKSNFMCGDNVMFSSLLREGRPFSGKRSECVWEVRAANRNLVCIDNVLYKANSTAPMKKLRDNWECQALLK